MLEFDARADGLNGSMIAMLRSQRWDVGGMISICNGHTMARYSRPCTRRGSSLALRLSGYLKVWFDRGVLLWGSCSEMVAQVKAKAIGDWAAVGVWTLFGQGGTVSASTVSAGTGSDFSCAGAIIQYPEADEGCSSSL